MKQCPCLQEANSLREILELFLKYQETQLEWEQG